MSVNDQVLDAIELLAKSSVERAGYDKTIQAQIISCQDKQLGKYKCKYQDALFYAYTSSPNINLSNGTMVYILVPQNDMSKDKTIIGTIDKLGTDFVTITQGEDAYEKVGINSLSIINSLITGNKLYLDTNYENYSYNLVVNEDITLDSDALLTYINKSSYLIVAATIQTQFPLNKQPQQNSEYGIKFTATFANGLTHDYILNQNNMTGQPFQLISPTRQVAIFPIDGENFTGISNINIYNKNFDESSGSSTSKLTSGDIILSNLEIYGANRLSQQQLNGVMITLITPDGSFFSTSDTALTTKRIMAQIKVKGQVVSSEGIPFYWGLEDMSVTSYHSKFNQYLGYGWQHITNIISETKWNSESNYLILRKDDIHCSANTYKVAAVYDGNLITRQITIQNESGTQIEITSSEGTQFFNNIGNPNLVCSENNGIHYWGWSNNGGYYQQAHDIIGNVNGYSLQQVQIAKIVNYAKFKCTVYNNGNLIGTGSITLTNEENDRANYLTLINGDAVFKYSPDGAAPTSDVFQNPQLIKTLTFVLRDSNGIVVYDGSAHNDDIVLNTIFTDPNCVIWRIPIENTLLEDQNNISPISNDPSDPYYEYYDSHYNSYVNTRTIAYDIARIFNYSKTNNQIKLQIHYNGMVVYAQTQFMFTKQGDAGTNGTEYTVKLVLNTDMTSKPQYPIITNVNGTYKINYGVGNSNSQTTFTGTQKLFKVQLWKSGQLLWQQNGSTADGSPTPTFKWYMLLNKYDSDTTDDSDFSVDASGNFSIVNNGILSSDFTLSKANIAECEISYNGKLYYGTIPIITAWVSNSDDRFSLKQGTGFRYVIYAADGTTPQYDNTNPFEIIWNNITSTQSGYVFSVVGGVKTKVSSSWSYNSNPQLFAISEQENQNDNKKAFRPIDRYDGQQVTNAIVCTYSTTAKIRIPVHFMLNRFGQNNINTWDGNKVKIDDSEGGYILAPQIGAGAKDVNNRFTGVLMGKVREAGKNNYNTGLFGYASGARSFFLDSETGKTILGKQGASQIIIDPSTGGQAKLYSGSFYTSGGLEAGAGLLINLTTPEIKYGNKNFWVDSNGNVKIGYYEDNNSDRWNFTVNATTGDVSLTGAITANSGNIGGINGWTIGSAQDIYNSSTGDYDWRGFIYSNNRNTWNGYYNSSTGSTSLYSKGIYFGTDGMSVGDGSKITFSIDKDGNVTINGDITLGAGSSISWNQVTSKPSGLATVSVDLNGNYTIADLDGINEAIVPQYIKTTYIDQTRIESPTIYAGKYYATGQGYNSGAAYYIYNGYDSSTQTLGSEIGYISYDTHGAGTTEEAANRVIFRTVNSTPLKILSAGNLSIEVPSNAGWVYLSALGGGFRVDSALCISPSYYGTNDPPSPLLFSNSFAGMLYFKIDPNS